MRRRGVVIIVCSLLLAMPSAAFFPVFGGIPVYDGANFAENLLHTAKQVAQIALQTAELAKVTQIHGHMETQATPIIDAVRSVRYRIPPIVWRGVAAIDRHGKIGRWINAVNSGVGTVEGWVNATRGIIPLPPSIASLPGTIRSGLELGASTIDLHDGVGIGVMDTLGRIRLGGPLSETALSMLESDVLSTSSSVHTQAAQMNKLNALQLIQARAMTDQNKLLAAQTEMALLRLKQERDAMAYALAIEAAFRTDGKAAFEAQHAGASDAMMNFRWP